MQQLSKVLADVASRWRRPSRTDPQAVDVIEIRSSLSVPMHATPQAFSDFITAVKRGEYDDLIDS